MHVVRTVTPGTSRRTLSSRRAACAFVMRLPIMRRTRSEACCSGKSTYRHILGSPAMTRKSSSV